MRKLMPIFIVKSVDQDESGRIHVIGRCGDIAIRVGDCFSQVFRHAARKYPEEAGREAVREQEKLVSLRVVCIHAYQRSLPELGEGMTGALLLEGDGACVVEPGWILGLDRDSSLSGERSAISSNGLLATNSVGEGRH